MIGGIAVLVLGFASCVVLVAIGASQRPPPQEFGDPVDEGGMGEPSTYESQVQGSSEATREVVEVTAGYLLNRYQANEVAADATYRGRRLRVTGTVHSIDKDFLDNAILQLETSDEFAPVRATLHPSHTSRAAALSRGAHVRLYCEGKGMILGSPMLDGCLIQ